MHIKIRAALHVVWKNTGLLNILLLLLLGSWPLRTTAGGTNPGPAPQILATVDGLEITVADYHNLFQNAVRQKFYHRKVPERELAEFQREVLQDIIDQLLLLGEADRLGLTPDAADVQARLQKYEEQYQGQPDWLEQRDNAMALMEQRFNNDSLLERLRALVRDEVPTPGEEAIRAYYEANTGNFTRPEQVRASVILLRVSPTAPQDFWVSAQELAESLVFRIREGGEDFADLAREYSGHVESAGNGGDLGYVHQVMFSDQAQDAVNALQPGEISEPILLLEGLGIFYLQDRIAPELLPYQEVRERAVTMLHQQQKEQAWSALGQRLRSGVEVQIHGQHLLPLQGEADQEDTAVRKAAAPE